MNKEIKICQNCKREFVIEPEDFQFYEKIKVPAPSWCPECRMIRRFLFRNERGLYRRKDDRTGKEIFSGIPPQAPFKVYEREYWWSDAFDVMQYGQDYDFSRPFFAQFFELMKTVPWPSRSILRLVNSDYSNNASDLKNSYLCFNSGSIEDSAYIINGTVVKDSFDLYHARHTELSYDDYMVDESYQVFFSVNCEECHEIWFSRNLIGCQNCFGCVNLRNKSYHIFNKPVAKETYQKFIKDFERGSYRTISEMRKKMQEFWKEHPMRFTLGINNVNCTGEHIEHSKNVRESYAIHEAENLKYCQMLEDKVTDSYDYTVWGNNVSLIYESCAIGEECSKMKFCSHCYPASHDVEYSAWCHSSSDLFGCVGLRKKQYCIFNKQYSKEEYFKLREKIIRHMNDIPYTDKQGRIYKYGEFFPADFSPFAYNETIAQDFFPLTKGAATEKGFLWRDPETREHATTINAADLPDHIKDVSDSILKEIIKCADCGKAYRIIQSELQFYRRIGLPLPRFCVSCRFNERFKFVNPPKFWPKQCDCAGMKDKSGVYINGAKHSHGENSCPSEFKTSYSPEKHAIVYCETCYRSEVI